MNIYPPGWVDDLVEQIDMTPGDIREQVVQEAVQEAGEAKGLHWMPYLQELHTIYLQRIKGQQREEERWAWLRVMLTNEPPGEQNTILHLLIEAMAVQQGMILRECVADLSSFTPTVIENHMRQILITGSLAGVELPPLITLLSRVQEEIEQERGLPPGTLIRRIAKKSEGNVLHLRIWVKSIDVDVLRTQIEVLFGKGGVMLVLDLPDQPIDDRTLYYQRRVSGATSEAISDERPRRASRACKLIPAVSACSFSSVIRKASSSHEPRVEGETDRPCQ